MNFRCFKLADCDKLDNLLNKLYQDERVNYDNSLDSDFVVKNYYEKYIDKDGHKIFLCEDNDRIVGYIYIKINVEKVGMIDALFVEKNYRNKGIASKLLSNALEEFKNNDVKYIEINVLSKNKIAKKLYKKFGFNTFKEIMRNEL